MSHSDQNKTTAEWAAEQNRKRQLEDAKWLTEQLRDSGCTDWTCLDCGRSQYKVYGLECDECGFDAEPFVPRDRRGLPVVRVQAESVSWLSRRLTQKATSKTKQPTATYASAGASTN